MDALGDVSSAASDQMLGENLDCYSKAPKPPCSLWDQLKSNTSNGKTGMQVTLAGTLMCLILNLCLVR